MTVPVAVSPGDTVTLHCSYDLEGDPLYTVKWYKGRQEFFRYVPKELPHTRVFPLPGVNVDVSKSGANQVVLLDVQLELAGKYRCEVSADAPTFHTEVVVSHMHVAFLESLEPFTIAGCVPTLTGFGGRTAMLHLCCERAYELEFISGSSALGIRIQDRLLV
ncbi:hypothetical protein B7P43_G00687 [Cryptotermes secundus]|uniref:Ig-like domain-containing protein n=1 Tax=Cryptotermes secundus TaxID=105785 RepID=A0A2J7RS41_9NEOP|nr:hypothetical protein B7P43_G00687 [Cryptotermes secundus]